ncbi:MAG: YebC/PmpR family DNA-binding transcriptional regulator [Bacteroidota bacterium]
MGRIFEKRKHKMFARYDRMAKAFTKIGREIAIAVREGGGDIKYNARLRIAVQNAKGVNMPKDRIDAAIKRALSKDEQGFQQSLYEGYAPHGIAVMVECATDNPTRTVANVRHHLTKHNGSLAANGSVAFMFERKGVFKLPAGAITHAEEFELEFIDYGLEDKGIGATSAELHYLPTITKELSEEHAKEVLELIEDLEADDDVQSVYHTLR